MTPDAKAARGGRSSDKPTGARISADRIAVRAAPTRAPREAANTRRRHAAQREAGPRRRTRC